MKSSRIPLLASALAMCALFLAAPIAWGQPKVSGVFPAGGQQGATVEVKLSGAFPTWPPQAEVIGEGVTFVYEKEKGKAKLAISKTAAPGMRLVRWYDSKGAADWRAIVVGSLKELNEVEPNDSPLKPQAAESPIVVNGRLQKSGDVDTYSLSLKKGQTLVAAVDGRRILDSQMDPVLQICDAKGFVLAQNDDERGLDPLLTVNIPKDGVYLVRTFCFPLKPNSSIQYAGGADHIYRLTMTTGAMVDHAMPLNVSRNQKTPVKFQGWNLDASPMAVVEPRAGVSYVQSTASSAAGHAQFAIVDASVAVAEKSSSEKSPQTVAIPVSVSGVIEDAGDEDTFEFEVKKRDRINFRVQAFDLGFPLDPILFVKSAEGKVLKEADDQSRGVKDVSTVVVAAADGKMQVQVRDVHRFGGPRYAYALTIEKEQPGFRLSAAAQSIAVAAGKEVELTINLQRLGGFKEGIELKIDGLPEGVAAEQVKLDAKAKSGKLKLKASADAKPFSGGLKVIGSAGEMQQTADYRVHGVAHSSIWLTVTGNK